MVKTIRMTLYIWDGRTVTYQCLDIFIVGGFPFLFVEKYKSMRNNGHILAYVPHSAHLCNQLCLYIKLFCVCNNHRKSYKQNLKYNFTKGSLKHVYVTGFGKTDHNVTLCISRNAILKH